MLRLQQNPEQTHARQLLADVMETAEGYKSLPEIICELLDKEN